MPVRGTGNGSGMQINQHTVANMLHTGPRGAHVRISPMAVRIRRCGKTPLSESSRTQSGPLA